METAAVIATVLLGILTVFQIALALGAPWGAAAWGGRHPGVLPVGYRAASTIAAIAVYPLIIGIVLASADLIDADWLPAGAGAMWLLTGFFALGVLANGASPSRVERLWAPVSGVIAICCAVIAAGM
ncbi:MAG: hypothetical protein ABFR89_09530 [Actinomycetota bacterium]